MNHRNQLHRSVTARYGSVARARTQAEINAAVPQALEDATDFESRDGPDSGQLYVVRGSGSNETFRIADASLLDGDVFHCPGGPAPPAINWFSRAANRTHLLYEVCPGYVTDNLALYYRADNVDGAGTPASGSTTSLVNLNSPGTYNLTLGGAVSGGGATGGSGVFTYGIPLATQWGTVNNGFLINGAAAPLATFTVEAWVRTPAVFATSPNFVNIIYCEHGGNDGRNACGFTSPNSMLRFDFPPAGGNFISAGAVAPSTYYQVVFAFDGSEGTVYVNGAAYQTLPYTTAATNVPLVARIGRNSEAQNAFNGQLCLLRVYENKRLNASEVMQNYSAET